jgi:hypothetical protein
VLFVDLFHAHPILNRIPFPPVSPLLLEFVKLKHILIQSGCRVEIGPELGLNQAESIGKDGLPREVRASCGLKDGGAKCDKLGLLAVSMEKYMLFFSALSIPHFYYYCVHWVCRDVEAVIYLEKAVGTPPVMVGHLLSCL